MGASCAARICTCPAGATEICPAEGSSVGACVDPATDEHNCGACGETCPATATCASGDCTCPQDRPALCGHSLAANGSCCAGDGCCGSGCQTAHANGLGQTYYDCGALNQYTAAQAALAAKAFAPAATPVPATCDVTSCLCVIDGGSSAVWCYSGSPNSGLVALWNGATCSLCPVPGLSNVHEWE
jgi:hypothetical protein